MQLNHRASAVLVLSMLSGATQAALVDRGNGMIYDTDRNITWLADADLLATQWAANPNLLAEIVADVPTVSNGRTTHNVSASDFTNILGEKANWWGAMAWAQHLQYGGFSDWRLARSQQPDTTCNAPVIGGVSYGFSCRGSELGHLFYDELGGIAGQSLSAQHNANFDLFKNVQQSFGYWTGTPFIAPGTSDGAWVFSMQGEQVLTSGITTGFGGSWAVRDGDVAAAVPEPASYALVLAGLTALAAARRPRRAA